MAIDPVCKMEVEENKAVATSEYKGKKYYFCAVGCKRAFDQNPEKYLAEEGRKYGIMFTPTVVINDRIVAAGEVMSEGELEKAIKKEMEGQS